MTERHVFACAHCGTVFGPQSATDALVAAQKKIDELNERLENNRLYEFREGKMVRVDVEPGSIPDGIDARNDTIKLLEGMLEEKRKELDAANVKLKALRSHMDP